MKGAGNPYRAGIGLVNPCGIRSGAATTGKAGAGAATNGSLLLQTEAGSGRGKQDCALSDVLEDCCGTVAALEFKR